MWQRISCDDAKTLREGLTLRGRGNRGGDFTTVWENPAGELPLRDSFNLFHDTCLHEAQVPDVKLTKRQAARKGKPATSPACTR